MILRHDNCFGGPESKLTLRNNNFTTTYTYCFTKVLQVSLMSCEFSIQYLMGFVQCYVDLDVGNVGVFAAVIKLLDFCFDWNCLNI